MVRLFFAFEPPAETLGRLEREVARVRDASPGWRWTARSHWHVTLAFLGEVEPAAVPGVTAAGRNASRGRVPPQLHIDVPGSFPPRGAPRVAWLGLGGDLVALQALRADLARELGAAGFVLEDSPYLPHLTLARRRRGARGGDAPLGGLRLPPAIREPFAVRELVLFRSDLEPAGPRYTVVDRAQLSV